MSYCPDCHCVLRNTLERWTTEICLPCQKCSKIEATPKMYMFLRGEMAYQVISFNSMVEYLTPVQTPELQKLLVELRKANQLSWIMDMVLRVTLWGSSLTAESRRLVRFLTCEILQSPKEDWATLLVQCENPEFWSQQLQNQSS